MAITETLTLVWGRVSETISKSVSLSSGAVVDIDEAIADDTTDGLVALTLDVSQLKLVYIVCDQAVTLETNSSSSPDDTLTLTADTPVLWYVGCGYPIGDLFSADVTALYVTNASGGTATLRCRFLLDPTV